MRRQAVILAGGRGTRLQPYSTVLPKPLMPIGDMPILEIIIRQLKHFGFNEVVIAVGYLKELIMAFFEDGRRWNIKIRYSVEEKALGTAAPLKSIPSLERKFLLMNGDILSSIDYGKFIHDHCESRASCTIALFKKTVKIDLGVIHIGEAGEVVQYIEKPSLDYSVSMGVYAINRRVLNLIPEKRVFDFPDLIHLMMKKGIRVDTFPFTGKWLDIGRREDFERASDEYIKNPRSFFRKK